MYEIFTKDYGLIDNIPVVLYFWLILTMPKRISKALGPLFVLGVHVALGSVFSGGLVGSVRHKSPTG